MGEKGAVEAEVEPRHETADDEDGDAAVIQLDAHHGHVRGVADHRVEEPGEIHADDGGGEEDEEHHLVAEEDLGRGSGGGGSSIIVVVVVFSATAMQTVEDGEVEEQ